VKVPLVLWVGLWFELLPLAAAAVARRGLNRPRAWILIWCAFGFASDIASLWVSFHLRQHNIWLQYLVIPALSGIALLALSFWQTGPRARLILRTGVIALIGTWALLAGTIEDTASFSRLAEPIGSLLMMAAAAYTMVALSIQARGELLAHDWFWIVAALVLYYASFTAIGPLGALLVAKAPQLVLLAYEVKAVFIIVAMAAIAWGMILPPSATIAQSSTVEPRGAAGGGHGGSV